MEQITEGVNSISIADSSFKKNRIQVSNTKKPLFFYVNLAKVSPFPLFLWYIYLLLCPNFDFLDQIHESVNL